MEYFERKINVFKPNYIEPLYVVQGSNMLTIKITFADWDIPTGATVKWQVITSTKGELNNATFEDNTVSIVPYNTTFSEAGKGYLQLRVEKDEKVLVSFAIDVLIFRDRLISPVEGSNSDVVKVLVDQYVEEATGTLFEDLEAQAQSELASIRATGNAVIASIPSDYSTLSSEVSDVRTGSDGTTYPTAGDAVRGQIGDLKSDFNNKLMGSFSLNSLLISGSYNATGGVVSNPKRIRTKGFIDITPNDVIVFKPSAKFKYILYGAFTTNGVFISDSPYLEGEQRIVVEENRKLILVFKPTPDENIDPSDFDATCIFQNIIATTKEELNEVKYNVSFDTLPDGMVTPDGSVSGSTSYKYTPYIYVPLNDGGEIQVSSTIYGNASLAFYDIHKNVIETINGNNAASYGILADVHVLTRTLTAPKNTQYIRASIGLQYGSVSQFNLKGTGLADVYNQLNNRDILTLNQTESMYVNAGANYGHHSNGYSNVDKRFTALITTDVHGDTYALNRAVDYANVMKCFDCGITLGDLQTGTFSDNDGTWYTNEIAKSRGNWLTLVGNHDFGIGNSPSKTGTVEQVYNKFIAPNLQFAGTIVDSGKCYYYKDYSNYKLRLFCLNPYDVDNYSVDSDGNYIVNRYTEYYSQEQIDWLVNGLLNTPSDYQVIILSHSAPAETTKNTDIKFNNRELGLPNEGTQTNLIVDIVNAWINGNTLSKSYSSNNSALSQVNVDVDFSSRGNGVFICYLTGHQHIDFVGNITKYPDQLILSFSSTSTDRYQNGGRIDLPRADYTKAEDCITSVSIDTANRMIYIVRIGSSVSKWFDKREPSAINY